MFAQPNRIGLNGRRASRFIDVWRLSSKISTRLPHRHIIDDTKANGGGTSDIGIEHRRTDYVREFDFRGGYGEFAGLR